jgi:DNA mismatch repair protein MSH6
MHNHLKFFTNGRKDAIGIPADHPDHKVARVEQTETPDALRERNRRMAKGTTKPEVVCREVCSVVSKGTRTFCYLDDVLLLESGEACSGPLVVIKETLVEDVPGGEDGMEVDGEDAGGGGTKAICEYGVTIVDAVTGVVTLGQFADDVLRSRMQTLLARFGPSEVREKDEGTIQSLIPHVYVVPLMLFFP